MTEPTVSVIMPVYNAAKYLQQAVDSVKSQTYANWELWMVNDKSTDNSAEIMSQLASGDARIHAIHLENNSGSAHARNIAIAQAKGKYIAFLDADDQWKPEKLKLQVAFMQQHNAVLSHTAYDTISASNESLHREIHVNAKVTYRQLLKNNTIGCLTAMYNAEALGKQFMPDLRKRQDYGLWLQILRNGRVAYGLDEVLATYRVGMDSLSGNKWRVLRYNWMLLRKHEQLSLISSTYYFLCFLWNKTFKYLGK
ncbi:MAG TPA: glycosyltransferase family 2 protein [Chitinophagales bacterium]|nr:glycosyltransferase family 2 protein [Chitinophagales bacterium]